MNIYKFGLTLKPFEGLSDEGVQNTIWEGLQDLTIGHDYYIFGKVESLGGISDERANRNFHKVGMEWDVFLTWRVTSDLNFTVRLGYFNPADAYAPKTKTERFLSTNLTLAF